MLACLMCFMECWIWLMKSPVPSSFNILTLVAQMLTQAHLNPPNPNPFSSWLVRVKSPVLPAWNPVPYCGLFRFYHKGLIKIPLYVGTIYGWTIDTLG